jgi:hypothetical protein
VDPANGTAKLMLTAIWGVNCFHPLDLTPSECRFNAQYFVEYILVPLVQKVFLQERTVYTSRLDVRLDNYRGRFSKVMGQFSIENQLP